jgi:hypothetical protein
MSHNMDTANKWEVKYDGVRKFRATAHPICFFSAWPADADGHLDVHSEHMSEVGGPHSSSSSNISVARFSIRR